MVRTNRDIPIHVASGGGGLPRAVNNDEYLIQCLEWLSELDDVVNVSEVCVNTKLIERIVRDDIRRMVKHYFFVCRGGQRLCHRVGK